MSCNACTKKYGFFCKESGCPNCGFSFCTKCLKKEIEVPRCKNTKLKVCLKCFEKLEREKVKSTVQLDKKHSIENNIFTIEEPFDAPILEPTQSGKQSTEETTDNDDAINENLDNLITKRLAGLKTVNDPITLPTDTEMASRLASLKGIPFKDYSNSDILLSTDTRTNQDKINDLLKQFVEEKNIDNSVKSEKTTISEIEKRLASLRNNSDNLLPNCKGNVEGATAVLKEEDEINQIVKQYLDEATLPEISAEENELIADLPKPSADTEELPWCIICNEDAVIRCIGCDGDLFCSNCYKVCHDDEDFRNHKAQTYSKPPEFKENHF